jgi:hypothetical protein
MPSLRHLTVVALSTLVVTGCATITAGSYGDRQIDFAQYHTYDWGPPDALPTGDPRLDSNPFFEDRFEGAVELQLARKGFGRADERPDLIVHYHANITQRLEVHGVEGNCTSGNDCEPRASQYDSGTLVLDFVDARTNKVVWRGWSQGIMNGIIGNQDRLEIHIDEAVRRIFEQFPGT